MAINWRIAIGHSGRRVLLVDSNIPRPRCTCFSPRSRAKSD